MQQNEGETDYLISIYNGIIYTAAVILTFAAMVKGKESDGRKPLTFELIALGDEAVVTFVEKY
jgi:hypothetical protein